MWWLVPLSVTLFAAAWAYGRVDAACHAERSMGSLTSVYGIFTALFYVPVAVILSLAAWLLWALLK